MTEDQKNMSAVLDILAASKEIPRPWSYISDELRLLSRRCDDVPALLEAMETAGLVVAKKDPIYGKRWSITKEGLLAR